MIRYKKGDILQALEDGEIDAFAHGVNCRGGFGKGIAGQIKEKYPEVREQYLRHFEKGKIKLGFTHPIKLREKRHGVIFNCATQDRYGYGGQKYCSYDAIEECLTKVKDTLVNTNLKLGLPKIGCGLAGGSWHIVKAIIEDVFQDSDVEVIVYEY